MTATVITAATIIPANTAKNETLKYVKLVLGVEGDVVEAGIGRAQLF